MANLHLHKKHFPTFKYSEQPLFNFDKEVGLWDGIHFHYILTIVVFCKASFEFLATRDKGFCLDICITLKTCGWKK